MKTCLNYFSLAKIPNKKAHTVQILKMCDALSSKFNVKLICGYSKFRNIKKKFNLKNKFQITNIIVFKSRIFNIIIKFLYILYFKSNKEDIIFTRDVHFAFFGKLFYKNIFLELHQTYLEKNNLSYFFLRNLFKIKKIKIIFISKELFKIYERRIGKPVSYIIAHDSSDDMYAQSSIKNITNSKKLSVGYCGHLYKGRGTELIVKLAKKEKNITFNILGGFINDKKKIINSMKIPKNVNFFPYKYYRNVGKFLLSNDILIAPYQKKLGNYGEIDTAKYMSPLKIFEYMSSKKAIISSNHKVLKEVLKNNKNSILCDPNILSHWTMAIKKLKNKKYREYLGNNAYRDFKKNFTWEKRVLKILNEK